MLLEKKFSNPILKNQGNSDFGEENVVFSYLRFFRFTNVEISRFGEDKQEFKNYKRWNEAVNMISSR